MPDLVDVVCSAILQAATGLSPHEVHAQAKLSDLGITSLEIVDVALRIEQELMIEEFPLQEWLDEQLALGEQGFSVQSLVDACRRVLNDPAESGCVR